MLSIVVPIYNEEENVPELHAELRGVLESLGRPYEVIYVDDGSSDGSFRGLAALADRDPAVVVLRFRRNFGQTAALAAGKDAARGDVLVFMDGDLQNDPADIPRLLRAMDEGDYDVVSGWRRDRRDKAISRKLPSRAANRLISWVSGVPLHDYGCTLKAYRREVIDDVRLYGEMHRFIPAYAAWAGARIAELPVNHRARRYGASKYGIDRTLKVLLDLLTLKFLSRFSTKPIQLFGGLGFLCFLLGGLAFLEVVYMKVFEDLNMNRNPLLLLTVVLVLVGVVLITQGLLAEMIARTYHESQDKPTYTIRTVLGRHAPPVARVRSRRGRYLAGPNGHDHHAPTAPDDLGPAAAASSVRSASAGSEREGVG